MPRFAAAVLAAAALLAPAGPARPRDAGPVLTSAPYDLSLFREGETRRMRARYGRWTVVCDEIMRLNSRYCSLSTAVTDASGAAVARLDVSTDEAGRPAGLLLLPHGTLLDRPTTLRPVRPEGTAARVLRVARCDAADCAAVWALAASDVAALRRAGLVLAYRLSARPDLPGAWLGPGDIRAVTGLVPAEGFAEAVAASLRAGPLVEAAPAAPLGLRR